MEQEDKRAEVSEETHPSREVERLRAELEALRAQLEEKEKEAKEHYNKFLRERADLENFKKRMERERAESLRFAQESLIRDLLPIIDNLERAVEHAEGGGDGQPLVEGVKLVLRSFLNVLEKYGVKRVEALGEVFDPNKHEAMAQVESSQHAPDTVVEEHHKGYFHHESLMRPALVTVSKAPDREGGGSKGGGGGDEGCTNGEG